MQSSSAKNRSIPSPVLADARHVQAFATLIRSLHQGSPIQVVGPFSVDLVPTTFMWRLLEFRHRQYREQQPYLLSEEQQQLESRLRLDARSTHFVAMQGEEIVAALRVTSSPFELTELVPELKEVVPALAGFAEFSRLIHDKSVRGVLGVRLMGEACLWAVDQGFEGIVGLCQHGPRQLFERYGLRPFEDREYRVPSRSEGCYSLMLGRWPEILETTVRYVQRVQASSHLSPTHSQGADRC